MTPEPTSNLCKSPCLLCFLFVFAFYLLDLINECDTLYIPTKKTNEFENDATNCEIM